MALSPTSGLSAGASKSGQTLDDPLNDLGLDEFFKLMITELQNQDPLEPLKNHEMLQQIAQIREIGATNKLNETLDAMLLGTSVSNGAALINKQVRALNSEGTFVTGRVDKVTIAAGDVKVHIGQDTIALKNVQEILPESS